MEFVAQYEEFFSNPPDSFQWEFPDLMVLFRDINLDLITSKINFSAKVYFKAHVRLHKDGNYIRLILVDEEGTRMEALAFGRTCLDLVRTIVEGEPYDFIDVVYECNVHVFGSGTF
ncbi:hypothetical protein EJB05_05541, partial [Eragrostis curvula]